MKVASSALVSAIFCSAAIGAAHAEVCWKLNPFIDVIRVAQTTFVDEQATGTAIGTHSLVVGIWGAGNFYSLPIVGSIDTDIPTSTPLKQRFGVHGTNHTTLFGNHSDCVLDAQLGSTPTWKLSCTGNVAGIFNNSGTFTSVPCTTAVPLAATGGKSAGDKTD
jgi:hypothetical protein